MWIEKYAPKCTDDLAINKQKIREFLNLAQSPGLLILTGPPGCGKNALINAYVTEKGHKLYKYTETNTQHMDELYGEKELVLGGKKFYPSDLENLITFIRKHSTQATDGAA